jgi:AsmA protein
VDLAMPSLRKFAAWAGTPVALPGDGLGKLAIKGRLSRAGDEIAFSDADIALDAMRAKGALTVVTAGPRPVLKGHLDVDRLDINPSLPPAAPRPATGQRRAAPAPAEPAGWSDAPLDFSGLKAVDADLDLTAGAILYRQLRIDRTRLGVRLQDGRLAAELREVALYGGAGNGRLAVDASGTVPALDLSFALGHVQIEPLLSAAAGMDRLSGTGTFNLAVAGKGGSQRALISSLDGKGALNLADGVVKGVNLLALAQSILPGGAKGEAGDNTTFGSLNGTFTIADGVLRNDDLLLKTRLAPVSGSGTVNLPTRGIDYRAVAQIAGAVKVPIQIGGTFERPTYRPELAGTIEQFRALVPGAGGSAAKPVNPADLLRGLLPR